MLGECERFARERARLVVARFYSEDEGCSITRTGYNE